MSERKTIIVPYDTTLRDGAQTPGVSFSVQDRIDIARRLDALGFPFIEGGFAGSNGIDAKFFIHMMQNPLERAVLTAFGMTRRKGVKVDQDSGLKGLLETGAQTIAVVGKSSLRHAVRTLGVSLGENIDMVAESIDFLRDEGREVIFDAEHYYYGYKENPEASLKIIEAAEQAGASTVVLCDTASGAMPHPVYLATRAARRRLKKETVLGVHVHNDTGVANAATLEAIRAGARHVQGTINGLGERTGNLDFCQFLPTAILKSNIKVPGFDLRQTTSLSRYVAGISKRPVPDNTPYVGDIAFKHKAGMHVDAALKDENAYNCIDPSLVGAQMSFEHSEQGGKANILQLAEGLGFKLSKDDPRIGVLVSRMKEMQVLGDAQGYLLLKEVLEAYESPFEVYPETYVKTLRSGESTADVKIRVNGGVFEMHEKGQGAFDAFARALRGALATRYPQVQAVKLVNYSVVLPPNQKPGTDSAVDVEISFQAGDHFWNSKVRTTDEQIANQDALIDAYRYWILRSQENN